MGAFYFLTIGAEFAFLQKMYTAKFKITTRDGLYEFLLS